MKHKLGIILAVVALMIGSAFAVSASADVNDPGSGCHGNAAPGPDCRPDPQPNHGQDCDAHGNNPDGNEDHCGPTTEPTPDPTPSPTPNPCDENPDSPECRSDECEDNPLCVEDCENAPPGSYDQDGDACDPAHNDPPPDGCVTCAAIGCPTPSGPCDFPSPSPTPVATPSTPAPPLPVTGAAAPITGLLVLGLMLALGGATIRFCVPRR